MSKQLTVKQKKFVNEVIKGTPKYKAYEKAGYKASTNQIARSESSKLTAKPNIQNAINEALQKAELTPEHAIGELAKIVNQDKELASKRLAIMNTLELHGWNKTSTPQQVLQINNQFFSDVVSDNKDSEVIDV